MKKREMWADIIRVVATIFVIIIHVLTYYRQFFFNVHATPQYLFFGLIDSAARSAVPIFFMLTGALVLSKNKLDIKIFYKKFVVRLIIPFLIFSVINYLYKCYAYDMTKPTITAAISQILNYPGTEYHLWFMYIIIFFYIFMPFLHKLAHVLNRRELLSMIILIFVLGNVFNNINALAGNHGKIILSGIALPDIIIYLNYLFVGYFLVTHSLKQNSRHTIYISGLLSLIALPVATLFVYPAKAAEPLVNACGVFPFIIGLAAFTVAKYKLTNLKICPIFNRFLSQVSSLSFYIYMIHIPIMEIITVYIFKYDVNMSTFNIIVNTMCAVIVTFILSLVVSLIFDKLYKSTVNLVDRIHLTKNHRVIRTTSL